MSRPICNIIQVSDQQKCTMCNSCWDYGDYDPLYCPNKGRKKLDVAFERMKEFVALQLLETNRRKSVFINVDELLKKVKK